MKFDDTLSNIGGFGKYQKLLILCFIIFYPGNVWQFSNINYLVGHMDHWCKVDIELEGMNKSHLKELTIPKSKNEFGETVYSKCEMYDINITELVERVKDFADLMPNTNWTRVPCKNGWEYDQTDFYSTIVSQYSLVCGRMWLQTIPAMSYFLGSLFGSFLAGYISDKWGRKWTTVIMVIGQIIANVAESFSPNIWLFVGFRFIVGICNFGAYSSFWILIIESMPPKYRNHCTYYCTLGRVLVFLLPIVAYFVRNHIHLHLVGAGFSIPGLILVLLLHESPRWLLSQKRYKEYDNVVLKIAKFNNATFTEEIAKEEKPAAEYNNNNNDGRKETVSVLRLLRTSRLRQRTLTLWFLWFSRTLVLFAFATNIGKLVPGNLYLNMILVEAGAEVPTFISLWFALFKSGRRLSMIIYTFISGLCCILMIPLILVKVELLVTIAALIAVSTIKTMLRILFLYTGEIYPTQARTIGLGTAGSISRIAGLIATQLPLLVHVWFGLPYIFLSTFAIASSVLAYFLPETKDCHLPETFEEAEMFGTPEYINCVSEYSSRKDAIQLSEPFIRTTKEKNTN